MPSNLRRFALGTLAAITALVGIPVATAHAEPPGRNCNPNIDSAWYDIVSAETSPVITHFAVVYIAPGTTGQQVETASFVRSVSTSINQSTSFEYSVGLKVFGNVKAAVGLSVQDTMTTTNTSSITKTYNFNVAGQYAVFEGTYRVQGEWKKWVCGRTGNNTGVWVNLMPNGVGTFVTWDIQTGGTASCATVVDPNNQRAGIIREAKRQLGCG